MSNYRPRYEDGKAGGKQRRKRGFLLAGVVLTAVALVTGVTMAKYVLQSKQTEVVEPSDFCFVVEGGGTQEKPAMVYTRSATLVVKNNDGLNVSKRNIAYTVTAKRAGGGSGASNTTVSEPSGVLAGGSMENKAINISGLEKGTYEITVSTSTPYTTQKTVYLQVEPAAVDSLYELVDYGSYCELTIYTGPGPSADISIQYPAGLAPDNTNAFMKDWTSGGSAQTGTLSGLEPNGAYHFVFFEQTPGEYGGAGQQVLTGGKIIIQ